jgi:asparagine synthase (glutamine-hydrolysing)
LLLAAYEGWGTTCPQHLVGDFAFSIWDLQEERLFCARDRMGARPFYYHYRPGQHFLWATECRQLLQHPGVSRKLHEGMIGAHLLPCPGQPDWSFFADIAQLPPAHSLCLDSSGLRVERYWDVDPRHEIRYRDDQEYEEHFLALFREAEACRLRDAGRTGILLSGGIDSGTIASVAGDLFRQGSTFRETQEPLWSFSWAFEELTECDERCYSNPIVEIYGLESVEIPADGHWLLSDYGQGHPVPDDPTTLMCPPLMRATLERARGVGVQTIVTGGGGNSLVGGNWPNYLDLWRGFRWRALIRDLARQSERDGTSWLRVLWRHVVRPALPAAVQNAIGRARQNPPPTPPPPPAWISSAFIRRVRLEEIRQASLPQRPFREWTRLRRYQSVTNEFETRNALAERRLCSEYDLDHCLPWRDARLFEFILAIPSDQVWRGGQPKDLVRRAMRGLLPEVVRTSTHIGSIQPLRTLGLRGRGRPMIEAALENPLLAQHGFVDAEILRTAYHRYCEGLRSEYPVNYALLLELWLRQLYM